MAPIVEGFNITCVRFKNTIKSGNVVSGYRDLASAGIVISSKRDSTTQRENTLLKSGLFAAAPLILTPMSNPSKGFNPLEGSGNACHIESK